MEKTIAESKTYFNIWNEAANVATVKDIAKKAIKKNYTVNPVIDEDTPVEFNHVNLYLENNGTLKLDCFFSCKYIETAYRRFRKIMVQAANDIPELKGWDNWLAADKITEGENGYWFNENGDMIFTPPDGNHSVSTLMKILSIFGAHFPTHLKSQPLKLSPKITLTNLLTKARLKRN